MKKAQSKGGVRFASLAILALVALVMAMGCQNPANTPAVSTYKDYLYMTEYKGGRVYTFDPAASTASSASFATSYKNAGEIAFYKGIGYVAIGMGSDEGVCFFDPSTTNPTFTKITGTVAAQYFAFYSATKAYVSTYGNGIYTFNPASPGSGLSASPIAGTAGLTMQGLAISGSYLYAADNGNGMVLRIDPADDTVKATITTTAAGTTGITAGTYNGNTGVFVANTGGYDASWNALPGSIDFVTSTTTATAHQVVNATSASASIYPGRIAQLPGGNLVVSGGSCTYFVTLSGASAAASEIKNGSATFGSFYMAYKDGVVYIPYVDYGTGYNYLFGITASGVQDTFSPLKVMTQTTDGIAGVAFFEE